MARVLISGYYGFGNLGDELILRAILNDVRSVDPEGEITVLSVDPMRTAERFAVRAVHRTSPLDLVWSLRRCDLFISGGGTLLQDATSRRSLWYYLTILALAQRMGKRTMIYSQGVGPLLYPMDRRLTRRVLENVDAITLRDEESRKALEEIGLKHSVIVTADPVLSLVEPGTTRDVHRIGWVLHGGQCGSRLLSVLEQTIRRLNQLGYRSCILPFHPQQDSAAAKHLVPWAEELAAEQVQRDLGRCGLIVSMRLHGLILGTAGGASVLALSQDPKLERFLHSLHLPPGLSTEAITAEQLTEAVLAVLEQPSTPSQSEMTRSIQRLSESSRQLERLLTVC